MVVRCYHAALLCALYVDLHHSDILIQRRNPVIAPHIFAEKGEPVPVRFYRYDFRRAVQKVKEGCFAAPCADVENYRALRYRKIIFVPQPKLLSQRCRRQGVGVG